MVKAQSYKKGPLKKIQGRSIDLYKVVDVTRNTQTDLRFLISKESDFYQRCYDYAIRISSLIAIQPSMPRITEKHVHRENTPTVQRSMFIVRIHLQSRLTIIMTLISVHPF